jgi:ABC-2 type transport system permease protein
VTDWTADRESGTEGAAGGGGGAAADPRVASGGGPTGRAAGDRPVERPVAKANPAFSTRRVGAMILRYWYLLIGSWPRILELAYWPTVQMVLWGFIQSFLATESSFFAQAGGILLGAILLWDILFRGQLGLSLSFFEEVWSRNLGHLMVSPLRTSEFIASLMLMSLIRTLIGIVPAALLAIWFFGFSIFELGLSLAVFFFSLILFGWAIGLVVSGLVLRYGQGAQSFAWIVIFALLPVSGVYYPVDILPGWLQPVAYALPASYVFEGMRAILIEGQIRLDLMAAAGALNLVYMAAGVAIFWWFLNKSREEAMLLQVGE